MQILSRNVSLIAVALLSAAVLAVAFRGTCGPSVDEVQAAPGEASVSPEAAAVPTRAEALSMGANALPLDRGAIEQDKPDAEPLFDPTFEAELWACQQDLERARESIARLETRITWMQTELQLCGSEVTQGPVGRWIATLTDAERPDADTLRKLALTVAPYPVELTPAEGLWIAERIRLDDWPNWGATIDEALILFLGPDRLVRELPPDRVRELRDTWAEEGYFK